MRARTALTAARRLLGFVVHDFVDFILHGKRWWVTAMIVTLVVFALLILSNEHHAVRPIIYTEP
jgi:hypothetical protein